MIAKEVRRTALPFPLEIVQVNLVRREGSELEFRIEHALFLYSVKSRVNEVKLSVMLYKERDPRCVCMPFRGHEFPEFLENKSR